MGCNSAWREARQCCKLNAVSTYSPGVEADALDSGKRGPGRPRDDARRERILAAALEIAAEDPSRVTLEQIATAAGVSRTTLYKWWDGAYDMVLEALLERTEWSLIHAEGTALERLHDQLVDLVGIMTDPATEGPVRLLASGAAADPETRARFSKTWLGPRRKAAAQIVREGIAAGELRADLDIDAVIDAIFAPIYERAFFTGAPLSRDLVDTLIAIIGPGISATPRA